MVSVLDNVPDAILEADTKEEEKRLLREWFTTFHGSRREAKVVFMMAADEEDLEVEGEDVEAIVKEPPVNTQT